MRSIVDVIVDCYERRDIISPDMKPVYAYGISLIVNDIINFSAILVLSAFMGKFVEGIIFLCVFYFLRVRCGGFHAKKVWICRMTMVLTFLLTLTVAEIILCCDEQWLVMPIEALSICILLIICPVENPNKILAGDIKRKNKIMAIITILIFTTISALARAADIKQCVIISITMLTVAVLAVIGAIINKGQVGGERDEKKAI